MPVVVSLFLRVTLKSALLFPFLLESEQDTMPVFEGILLFKPTSNVKKNNKKNPSCCQFGSSKTKGALILLEEPNRQQLLFVFVLFMALKNKIPSKICVPSCFV